MFDHYNIALTADDQNKHLVFPKPIKRFRMRCTTTITFQDIGPIGNGAFNLCTEYYIPEGLKSIHLPKTISTNFTFELLVFEYANAGDNIVPKQITKTGVKFEV